MKQQKKHEGKEGGRENSHARKLLKRLHRLSIAIIGNASIVLGINDSNSHCLLVVVAVVVVVVILVLIVIIVLVIIVVVSVVIIGTHKPPVLALPSPNITTPDLPVHGSICKRPQFTYPPIYLPPPLNVSSFSSTDRENVLEVIQRDL